MISKPDIDAITKRAYESLEREKYTAFVSEGVTAAYAHIARLLREGDSPIRLIEACEVADWLEGKA
ncbi:MAG: hypothetical protein WC683_20075 [bacterium]